MQKTFKYGTVFLLFVALILVRNFATKLFYDPLSVYFKDAYLREGIPKIDYFLYFKNIFYRYLVNAVFSVAILYLLFKRREVLVFSVWFYAIGFLVLSSVFFLVLKEGATDYKLIFYIRRFLIHPVFLLLLIPAFYQRYKG